MDTMDAAMDGTAGAGPCRTDEDCDDTDFCNGVERCVGPGAPGATSRGCVQRPRSADELSARCQGALCSDRDGDGHRPIVDNGTLCTGANADDCNDNDVRRFPRAGTPDPTRRWAGTNETCGGSDEHDEDCDALTVAGPLDGDADGDGYPSANCCNVIAPLSLSDEQRAMLPGFRLRTIGGATGGAVCGTDCNDRDPTVHPGAMEDPCNGIDDNCDGVPDEGGRGMLYRDCDGDGDGDPSGGVMNACLNPIAIICNGFPGSRTNTDCNDRDPRARGNGGVEVCDGIDNDCDGTADNGAGMECAVALPGETERTRPCTDSACSMRSGVQTCRMCRWTPSTCQRGYERPVRLNTNGHECEPGELTETRCTGPGRTASCGRVVCSAACEQDPLGECRFDRETCDYLDQDCNGRTDEGLGRGCEQTWQSTGNGFATDWRLENASIDPMSGEILLSDGSRNRASAAFLPLTIDRARSIEITIRVQLSRGETEYIGEGMSVVLAEAEPGTSGLGVLSTETAGIPSTLRGYVFRFGNDNSVSGRFVRIERRTGDSRILQQTPFPILSPVTGDTCGGPGHFQYINVGTPSSIYRGGGENEISITITDQLVSFAMAYLNTTGRCVLASGTEPDASLYGRPLRLGIITSSDSRATMGVRLRSVRLRRPCSPMNGGTCEATPNYCPAGGTVCP